MKINDKEIILIDDAYNANPSSMKASIQSLGLRVGRKIAVLGDMLELGSIAQEMHEGLVSDILNAGIDKVYLVGDLMKHLWKKIPDEKRGSWCPKSEDLIPVLKTELKNNDIVLIKASHGTRLDVIIESLKGK